MISPTSRLLTRLLAVLYTALGLIMFFVPEWSSANFAWKIRPFVAMTIGGWCLGNAAFAWLCAQNWQMPTIYSSLVYLWLFGLLESIVVVVFVSKLITNTPLAILYLIALLINLLCLVLGARDWLRLRPSLASKGAPMSRPVRALLAAGITVGALVVSASLFLGEGVVQGTVLPEPVSLFTIRAFSVFYISLLVALLSLLRSKTTGPFHFFSLGGLVLTGLVLVAAIIYLSCTDFQQFPWAAIYLGVYVLTTLVAAAFAWVYRPVRK